LPLQAALSTARSIFFMDHTKRHYYMSHAHINPTRMVPAGPQLKFMEDAAR
jgi:glutathionyl-hydroquinone reductase